MMLSPLLGNYAESEFLLGEARSMRIALSRRDAAVAASIVADLSALRKWLVVGDGAAACLTQHELVAPELLQRRPAADGRWIAALAPRQFLVSEDIECDGTLDLTPIGSATVLEQDWVEIAIEGPMIGPVFAELCSTDLAQSGAFDWIPSLLAGIEAAIYRGPKDEEYRVLCAPADGPYLFGVLAALTHERGGLTLGFDDYRRRRTAI